MPIIAPPDCCGKCNVYRSALKLKRALERGVITVDDFDYNMLGLLIDSCEKCEQSLIDWIGQTKARELGKYLEGFLKREGAMPFVMQYVVRVTPDQVDMAKKKVKPRIVRVLNKLAES